MYTWRYISLIMGKIHKPFNTGGCSWMGSQNGWHFNSSIWEKQSPQLLILGLLHSLKSRGKTKRIAGQLRGCPVCFVFP